MNKEDGVSSCIQGGQEIYCLALCLEIAEIKPQRGRQGYKQELGKQAMKVILLKEVQGLGQVGDVKDVSDGYARNFLLPKQLVTPATTSALANLKQHVAAERRKAEKIEAAHQALAEQLAEITLTFQARAGKGGRLYGSITSQDIAEALKSQNGISIDRRSIELPEPLRAVGTYEVPVHVSAGKSPKLTVVVESTGPVEAEE
jgi:large subunit ribosomal protein L9